MREPNSLPVHDLFSPLLMLSLEIDCRGKVEPQWYSEKVMQLLEQIQFPKRKVREESIQCAFSPAQLTRTGTGTGLGRKNKPKTSITMVFILSSVPLWKMLRYYKVSFSH